MQLTAIFLVTIALTVSAKSNSQTISFSGKNVKLEVVLKSVEKQSAYHVVYNQAFLEDIVVSIDVRNVSLTDFLDNVLKGQQVAYSIQNTTIFIEKKGEPAKNALIASAPAGPPPITVKGRVVNETGDPVQATISVKGLKKAVSTNEKGEFELAQVSSEAILEVSGINIDPFEIAASSTYMNLNAKTAVNSLEQAVVIGYGTQKKATLTGAVVSTTGDAIRQSPATNLTNSLVGRLPGLTGVTRSGEPGSDNTQLLIRGTNTLGDNTPLVVVDGIAGRDFSRLNPADIESISVLKDASAAIYGARAANGVIMVTTKRGKTGKPTLSLNANTSFQQPTVVPGMADAPTYVSMLNELSFYGTPSLGRYQRFSEEDIKKYGDGSDPWGHPNTDWFHSIFKPWSNQNYQDISISGGSENLKYFLSLSHRTQDGVYKNSGTKFTAYNFRSNIDAKVSKAITVSLDLSGSQENKDFAVTGVGGIFRSIFRGHPNTPAFWPDGTPGPSFLEFGDQPAVTSTKANGYNLEKWYRLQSNGRINIVVPWIKGLSIQGNVSVDKIINNQKVFRKPWYLNTWDGNAEHITVPGKVGIAAPQLNQYVGDEQQITLNTFVTYDHVFAQNHNFKFMVGTEKQTGLSSNISAARQNYISDAIDQLFAGPRDQYMVNDGNASQTARLNYFGRVNYDYDRKYLLEFVWRYDGSFNFPKDKRFGFFPGISAGWRVSEEKFWQEKLSAISDFKFRASWGQTGNDRIDPYQYLSTYVQSGSYVFNTSNQVNNLIESVVPNPNVTWEVANQTNIGFDAGLMKNKLTFSFDYFHNVRSNILWQRNAAVPGSAGMTLPRENIGKVDNRGWEAVLGYRNRAGEFNYSVSASGSFQKNKIVYWAETPGVPEYQKSTGRPMGSALYYEATGIFNDQADIDKQPHWAGATPGDVIFRDVNGDGKIDGLDMVRNTKNDFPTFTGSFTVSLEYKQFDLSMLIQGASGSQKYIRIEGGETGNYYKLWADNRWTPEHTDAAYAKAWNLSVPYWDNQPNTYWLYSSDYIRLKNVELGYSLSAKNNQRLGIQGLRIYVNGLNLITRSELSKNKMMDPEADYNYSYPLQRIINAGLTLTF